MSKIFNIEKAEKESGLPANRIDKIEKEIRAEFPHDDLMYELHLIRAIAYYKGLARQKLRNVF